MLILSTMKRFTCKEVAVRNSYFIFDLLSYNTLNGLPETVKVALPGVRGSDQVFVTVNLAMFVNFKGHEDTKSSFAKILPISRVG